MPKSDAIERTLVALSDLRKARPANETTKQLRAYLGNRSNLVVAKAAKIAGELRLNSLIPDLVGAFERLWVNPARLDKRCAATTEIITALYQLDYLEPDIYLRGLHHVQKEASFGPPIDVAAEMRGISAQGLLRTRHPDAMTGVVSLLVDPEPSARLGAVRALSLNGGEAGVLLLRLKLLTGDKDAEIVSECFSGLMSAAPEQSLAFVANYMDDNDEVIAEAAIWALGQSRQPAALPLLKEKWERTLDASLRKAVICAIAASRLEEASDYLCAQLNSVNVRTAGDILEALAKYASSEKVKRSAASAVEQRGDRQVIAFFAEHFASR